MNQPDKYDASKDSDCLSILNLLKNDSSINTKFIVKDNHDEIQVGLFYIYNLHIFDRIKINIGIIFMLTIKK
jgi:hypothetical protein